MFKVKLLARVMTAVMLLFAPAAVSGCSSPGIPWRVEVEAGRSGGTAYVKVEHSVPVTPENIEHPWKTIHDADEALPAKIDGHVEEGKALSATVTFDEGDDDVTCRIVYQGKAVSKATSKKSPIICAIFPDGLS